MTTVAFKEGIMAADSKCSDGYGAYVTRSKKIERLTSGALLGCAGDADAREVIRLLDGVKTAKSLPSREALAKTRTQFYGILALPRGGVFYVDIYVHELGNSSEWDAQVVEVHEKIAAVGSGQQFAMGAMAAGRSAAQAVAIACRYDLQSGPPIIAVTLARDGRK